MLVFVILTRRYLFPTSLAKSSMTHMVLNLLFQRLASLSIGYDKFVTVYTLVMTLAHVNIQIIT